MSKSDINQAPESTREKGRLLAKRALAAMAIAALAFAEFDAARAESGGANPRHGGAAPTVLAPDFISAVAGGVAMNDAGDMVGTSYTDIGCGPFCVPPQETVAWKAGRRIVLPSLPGFDGTSVTGINNRGWISGSAGVFGFTHAVVWKPKGDGYAAIDLGLLPGTAHAVATGIDDSNRVVGYATNTSGFQTPFVWTKSGGMVDLSAQGFPNEIPLGVSRGGTVATYGYWYRLGEPGSVTAMAAAPEGGWFVVNAPVAINDAGDQARGLGIGTEHPFTFVYRYRHSGSWQQIDFFGTGKRSPGGIGSINDAQDITSTVSGSAQIAYGPDGLNQPLTPLLSPAYGGALIVGGPMNAAAQIMAQMQVGLAGRLVRLTPVAPCAVSCIRVSALRFNAKFHQDPADPGHCTQGDKKEYNVATARITATDETGAPLNNVLIGGRFMDQYWTNAQVSGATDATGTVKFRFKDPCGVGTESFIVETAARDAMTFDKTSGVLAASMLPKP